MIRSRWSAVWEAFLHFLAEGVEGGWHCLHPSRVFVAPPGHHQEIDQGIQGALQNRRICVLHHPHLPKRPDRLRDLQLEGELHRQRPAEEASVRKPQVLQRKGACCCLCLAWICQVYTLTSLSILPLLISYSLLNNQESVGVSTWLIYQIKMEVFVLDQQRCSLFIFFTVSLSILHLTTTYKHKMMWQEFVCPTPTWFDVVELSRSVARLLSAWLRKETRATAGTQSPHL